MAKLPQIRIRDAWLLREAASRHLHEIWAEEGDRMAGDEEMKQIVMAYIKSWRPYEQKIMNGMCELTGLEFRQNTIDVYIAPWFRALSDPLIIGVMQTPDQFIDVLTHEILHRLLTDNTSLSYEDDDHDLISPWKALFGKDHSFNAVVHIPVHAVHKAIYLDVLKAPERLERDIETCKQNGADDYVTAWEYVNRHDYKQIIKELKESYGPGP